MPNEYVVKYKSFADGGTAESLFARAAEFATRIGSNRVINISHSEDTLPRGRLTRSAIDGKPPTQVSSLTSVELRFATRRRIEGATLPALNRPSLSCSTVA